MPQSLLSGQIKKKPTYRVWQRKFIDWKKTKLFLFRWNWAEEKKLCGIRLQISSFPLRRGEVFVDTVIAVKII